MHKVIYLIPISFFDLNICPSRSFFLSSANDSFSQNEELLSLFLVEKYVKSSWQLALIKLIKICNNFVDSFEFE